MAHRYMQIAAGVLFLLAPSKVRGQFGSAQPNVPAVASGQMPTAIPGAEAGGSNNFSAMFEAGARYDDNAVLSSARKRSDIGYSLRSNVSLVQTLRRFDYGLSYSPGVDISQHGFFPDQFTNAFGGHFTWLVSKHSAFSAQENYVLSTDPFQQFGTQPFGTTPGPVVAPNASVFLPNVRRTASLSQVQYSYQPRQHTTLGLSGNYTLSHYGGTSSTTNPTLLGFQVASGQAYIAQQITPRNQLGVQYSGQVLKFQQVSARTTTHSFSVFDQIRLKQNMNLTLYAGPQYALISNQATLSLGFATVLIPIRENTLSWSGGAIFQITGRRGAMVLDYSRGVSDGGGITGAVELNAGSVLFNWKLSPNWSMRIDGAAADNQLLGVKTGTSELRTYSATLGLSRRIFSKISMDMFFERLNQSGTIIGLSSGNHDLAGVSLSYGFSRPIGR
jgi:hypothetical protein